MPRSAATPSVAAVASELSRAQLLGRAVALGAGGALAGLLRPEYLAAAEPQAGAVTVANPLTTVPSRDRLPHLSAGVASNGSRWTRLGNFDHHTAAAQWRDSRERCSPRSALRGRRPEDAVLRVR